MHRKDLLVNDGRNRKAVEAVRERLPQLNVVPALALVVKAVDAVDRGTFVVSSQDEEVFRILDLVGQEEADGLKRLLATVDIIAQEEVVGLGREASVFEESEEIVVLAVDISANLRALLAEKMGHIS